MLTSPVLAQQAPIGYDDTPMQPNGKWRVHDGTRPYPPVVTPGGRRTPCQRRPTRIVLLGAGDNLERVADGRMDTRGVDDEGRRAAHRQGHAADEGAVHRRPAARRVRDAVRGARATARDAATAACFCSATSRSRCSTAIDNITYADGQAAAMYGQYPPLVNALAPPGQWQTTTSSSRRRVSPRTGRSRRRRS